MLLVPVIDLKGGMVVQAMSGARHQYPPVTSKLCDDGEPANVVDGYLNLHPFPVLYVADLDAIDGKGDNASAIRRLADRFPGLELWVDCGLTGRDACRAWLATGIGHLVLGSESQRDDRTLKGLLTTQDARRVILSLDFREETLLGPGGLAERPGLWPDRVIAMTLTRIGGDDGPDTARLAQLKAMAPDREVFAAGGVRNARDLVNLDAAGARGALLASALHDGRIGRPEIERVIDSARTVRRRSPSGRGPVR